MDKRFLELAAYIEAHYEEMPPRTARKRVLREEMAMPMLCECEMRAPSDLDRRLAERDESFSQMLLRDSAKPALRSSSSVSSSESSKASANAMAVGLLGR